LSGWRKTFSYFSFCLINQFFALCGLPGPSKNLVAI
jgi:hypothetical protein